MKTDFDLTLINSEILEISVHPDIDLSQNLSFTWKVESFEGKIMIISLKFTDPLSISQGF